MKRNIMLICSVVVVALMGCAKQPRVLFTFWSGDQPVRHIAIVRADGSFQSTVRWDDHADIFRGTVTQYTGGWYQVSSLHEGHHFVGKDGNYEYNSYTNTQYLRPNEIKVLLSWKFQDEDRDTTLMLKMK